MMCKQLVVACGRALSHKENSCSLHPSQELPPIHHLPPEMMLHVLSYLPVYQLG